MDPASYSMPVLVQSDRDIVVIEYFELNPFNLGIFQQHTFKIRQTLNSFLLLIHPLAPPAPQPRVNPWQTPVAAGAPYCISFNT
jgi:hypothetical protein